MIKQHIKEDGCYTIKFKHGAEITIFKEGKEKRSYTWSYITEQIEYCTIEIINMEEIAFILKLPYTKKQYLDFLTNENKKKEVGLRPSCH